MDRMFRARAPIVVFEPFSQRMSRHADNSIHLRIKRFWPSQGLHGDGVLLDFVNCSFEVLFTYKCQNSSMVVRPAEYARRQNVIYFSPLSLKLADR